jgi:hypothetical protein
MEGLKTIGNGLEVTFSLLFVVFFVLNDLSLEVFPRFVYTTIIIVDLIGFMWFNSYAFFLLFKCFSPPIFISTLHHFPLQLKTIDLFHGIKGLLPHFCANRIFISFSYGLLGSNPCHKFPKFQ